MWRRLIEPIVNGIEKLPRGPMLRTAPAKIGESMVGQWKRLVFTWISFKKGKPSALIKEMDAFLTEFADSLENWEVSDAARGESSASWARASPTCASPASKPPRSSDAIRPSKT